MAYGGQDALVVGQRAVSWFMSTFKRHSNSAQTVERQTIQGNRARAGMSTILVERKGDMLGYVYIANRAGNVTAWNENGAKVELLIGGQVIDEQDYPFSTSLAPRVMNHPYPKAMYVSEKFYPRRFSCREKVQSAIPLVALQYHDVEVRVTWADHASIVGELAVHAQLLHLDKDERTALSNAPHNMLITQTQKAYASLNKVQELSFNHPMMYLVAVNGQSACDKVILQITGTDVSDAKPVSPHHTSVPV